MATMGMYYLHMMSMDMYRNGYRNNSSLRVSKLGGRRKRGS